MAEEDREAVEERLPRWALQNDRWRNRPLDPAHWLSENGTLHNAAAIFPDADCHGDRHSDADGNGNGYRDFDTNRHRNGDIDPYADVDPNANGYADPHAHPHTHGITGDRLR